MKELLTKILTQAKINELNTRSFREMKRLTPKALYRIRAKYAKEMDSRRDYLLQCE